jgi:outer membrane protein TolC
MSMLCAAFPGHAAEGSPEAPALSEEAYLDLVLEYNEDLGALRKEVEAKLYAIRGDLASQRPSLGITTDLSRWLDQERGDRYADLAVTTRIDLGGRYPLQEQDFLLGLRVLESRYANSVNETLAKGIAAYRQTVMARHIWDMRTEVLEHRRQSLEVTQEKFDKELVPLLDLLRAQSQVDEGEAFLLQARQSYQENLIEMRALGGQKVVLPRMVIPQGPPEHLPVDFEGAWEGRPDVRSLLLLREQASVRHTLAARGLAPFVDISLGWRLGEDYRSPYVEDRQGEVLARAVFSVPLGDGGKTRNATQSAALLAEKIDRELDAKRDTVEKEIALVRERWVRGLALEGVRRRQMQGSAQELEIAEMLYREGLASQLDLLSAQERDQQSRADHLATIQELWLTLAEANRIMGRYSRSLSELRR